jgi:Skp family chaperone for outer membrane proteins
MKTFRLFAAGLFIAAFFSISVFAQTAQPSSSGKIVYINVVAFNADKGGITKYITAVNSLDSEFKTVNTELQTMGTRYQTLANEIKSIQERSRDPKNKVPIDERSAQTKIDEYGKLERDIKFKQEDAKARFQSRYSVVVGPIMQDIMKAMQDFAKQKGYSMILDAAKLDEAGIILAVGNDSADVTKDFITFYNSRPAGTASVDKP